MPCRPRLQLILIGDKEFVFLIMVPLMDVAFGTICDFLGWRVIDSCGFCHPCMTSVWPVTGHIRFLGFAYVSIYVCFLGFEELWDAAELCMSMMHVCVIPADAIWHARHRCAPRSKLGTRMVYLLLLNNFVGLRVVCDMCWNMCWNMCLLVRYVEIREIRCNYYY